MATLWFHVRECDGCCEHLFCQQGKHINKYLHLKLIRSGKRARIRSHCFVKMPRCYAKGIRGGSSKNNLSGEAHLMPRSRVKLHRKTRPVSFKTGHITRPQYRFTSSVTRATTPLATNKIVRYKSMNYLSFVTRFHLIRSGTPLEVAGSVHDTDVWLEETPFTFDKTRWSTDIKSEDPASKKDKDQNITDLKTFDKNLESGDQKVKDKSIQSNLSCNMGKLNRFEHGMCDGSENKLLQDLLIPDRDLSVQFENIPNKNRQTNGVENESSFDFLSSIEAQEAASAAETLVALANNSRVTDVPSPVLNTNDQCSLTDIHRSSQTNRFNVGTNTPSETVPNPVPYKYLTKNVEIIPSRSITDGKNNVKQSLTLIVGKSMAKLSNDKCAMDIELVSPDITPTNIQGTTSKKSTDSDLDSDMENFESSVHTFAKDANGNKIHKCKLCAKVFTILAAFKSHVSTHYKQKNKCSVCGKHFSRSWLLKGHMRTHTGERPYPCDHPGCDKAFADKSNLRSHALIHSAAGKCFVCDKCNKAFAQKRYLHKHTLEVCKV